MGADKPSPSGIELRKGVKSESIRIKFMYRGVECRETLKMAHTKQNIRYAERLRGEILNAIERKTFNYAEYFPDSKMLAKLGEARSAAHVTVGELLLEQLDVASRTLSLNTIKVYRNTYLAHLKPQWGDTRLADLTPAALRAWIGKMTCKARTVRQILIPLRGALEQAVNDDLIEFNPLDRVKLQKILTKESKVVEFEPDPFSVQEIEAILAACDGQERNVWRFAFATGMRPSEYMALQWQAVDWLNGGVAVCRARVERTFKDGTKTEAGRRIIDLREGALAALLDQKVHTALVGDLVFHDPRYNAGWQATNTLQKRWVIILRRAGVRYRNLYQTRHTFASTLLSCGENPLYVAKQMGHRDTTMITKSYGRWIEQDDGVLPAMFARAPAKIAQISPKIQGV